ncbi:MAG: Inner membrane protein YgaZ [Chloroflexi bacterium ADurb.Bin325]|nr:MAG: Inner membrane protein YgaZ [Chloroflexi bacterium ADurb.Bin325]
MPSPGRKQQFFAGLRAEAPILLGVAPFGLIFGALALNAGMPAALVQATSSIIFAGSAQFITAQLFGAGASGLVIVMVVFVVNLRHVLYSASIAPYVKHLGLAWKVALAYLLTDEAYAVVITYYQRTRSDPAGPGSPDRRHWYFLGAGLALWVSWQLSTLAGLLIGARLPESWPTGFFLPLTFIALVVPALRDRPSVVAAAVAGLIGLAGAGLPFKTGLLLAALIGIVAGTTAERRDQRAAARRVA